MVSKSESIKELSTALAKAQSDICNPKKTSANPFFKSSYADLSEVINVSKPVLAENGLSIVQMPSLENGAVHVESMILHSSGEFVSSTMSMPISKNDPQSIGSLISYIRRYSWASICSLAQEDDDGNAASGKIPEVNPDDFNRYLDSLRKVDSLPDLQAKWTAIPKIYQPLLAKTKDDSKELLSKPS